MEEHTLRKMNPWVTIWSAPRETMRYILHTDPTGTIIWLALISGLIAAFAFLGNLWMQYPNRENFRYGVVVVSVMVAGAIFGVIHLYFMSWLYRITGNWLGGKGTFTEIKAAVGWANYPFILSGIVSILAFFLLRHPLLYFIFTMINLILIVWGVVIAIKLIAEAHGFSAWRAIATIIIAMLLIVAVIMIIVLAVPFFYSAKT